MPQLLGEHVALADINGALDHLASGHALRQVVVTGG